MRNVLLFLTTILLAVPSVRADLILLKDGTVLHGKSVKENVQYVDPISKETTTVSRGFFFIDDGARRMYFSSQQLKAVEPDNLQRDVVFYPRTWTIGNPGRMMPILEVQATTDWDADWNRHITYRGPGAAVTVKQHLAMLNTTFLQHDCLEKFVWYSFHSTQELGPEKVRKLLLDHKDFQVPLDLPVEKRAERRFRLYRFLLHAGWLDFASTELQGIERDLPTQKKQVEEAREQLMRLRVRKQYDEIVKADQAGRRKWVADQVAVFSEKYSDPKHLEEVRTMRLAYEKAEATQKEVLRLFEHFESKLTIPSEKELFRDALTAIRRELHPRGLSRLDLFLEQGRQALRQEKTKGKADQPPTELLSLAVTGWMLGGASADIKVDVARQVWQGRQLLGTYLTAGPDERRAMLMKYLAQADLPTIDQLSQLIALSLPPESEEKLPTGITEQKASGTTYQLQLPDEYHPGRPTPVLVVLHSAGEEPKAMMERWADRAREEGYILVAPHWSQGVGGGYGYSQSEQDTVLETLRDLRKRFNVDCDRVFLFGFGSGATMACDVGMSYPDLFAGVMSMSGQPEFHCRSYNPNAQYLPFYLISGNCMGEPAKSYKWLIEKWIPGGYPSILIEYKGRGAEWFGAEVTPMFDWMSRKKRSIPVTQLGRWGPTGGSHDFQSLRAGNNRFYWITGNGLDRRRTAEQPMQGFHLTYPAAVSALINPADNKIFVSNRGWQSLTLWLSRDAKLDFEKPVRVSLNGPLVFNRKVTPSIATLLEDFLERRDRQRLYVARIDVR